MTNKEAIQSLRKIAYHVHPNEEFLIAIKAIEHKEHIMTDREMKNIATVLRNYIYTYVNENYKDNLDVLKFTLEINEEHMETWVKDILTHDILWRDPERLQYESE